ncbi:septum formation family protein [Micromonospora sp. WMMD1082]|uniref:septum formation family protein n=1 Tax=Micromonospora sp. WMMD1082 TaxID=3016104 RepID=UPI0024162088|nr:septum formation family protein [Micromonospora sp. WMMD1082]MDG4794336.1 septum formation family protein [Micromonospora sp. WMMD1082]
MQRATRTLIAAFAVAVLLAGCNGAAGVDGDLVDDWAALPPPGPFTPAAGVCHEADFADVVPLGAYAPVDCAVPHRLETVHVGAFPDGRSEPPPIASTELRTAFVECDNRATGYVGDNWRAGRLRLAVAVPSGPGWASGSRWYRCDLMEVTTAEAGATVVTRTGSLRDALRPPSPLRLGCQQARTDRRGVVQTLVAVDCASRHDAEFAGVWQAPDRPYPTRSAEWAPFYGGCRSVTARYAGVPDDAALPFRTDVVVRPPGAGRWRVGDRGIRCYLWLSDRAVTGSLEGAGPARLPVRTK